MTDTISYDSPDTDGYNALGPTEARPLAGDHNDDDGIIFDGLLEPGSDGDTVPEEEIPTPFEDLSESEQYDWSKQGPKPTTRIVTQTIPLVAGAVLGVTLGTPIQVLPADPNRIMLRFRLTSGAPDTRWADELNTCYGAGQMADTDQPVELPHTGALWILPTNDDSAAYLHYWAVIRND